MASAKSGYSVQRKHDPYQYQVGFGNSFASEALPGVLPIGQNNPQKVKYDLYTEGINGTPFTTPRENNERTHVSELLSLFYRIRPSVAHLGFELTKQQNTNLEAEFSLSNTRQHISISQLRWDPLPIPSPNTKVTFIDGLATLLGNGGPMSREGLAIHLYSANASMEKTAFVNSDGDFLIVPVEGKLDIQTELGKLMVEPGEIAVVQKGIKWKVVLPDGSARGYIQEIFGSHYELPELGPLGANGLANVRDFEHPVAHFDIDQTPWDVIHKLGGKYFTCKQNHTPFDVVAWHGNYVPYKYDLDSFIGVGSITKDHPDPSIFTVLTARSKTPGAALADFAIFKERWDVAENTFRPPYFHRNTCVEVVGAIKGSFEGRSDDEPAGGLTYESGFSPHGINPKAFAEGTEGELVPTKIGKDSIFVLFESSMMCTITDFGIKNTKGGHEASVYEGHAPNFLKHINEINGQLKAANLPALVQN